MSEAVTSSSTSIQTTEGETSTESGGSQERDGDIQETYPLPSDLESYGYMGNHTAPWMDPRGVETSCQPPTQPYLNQPDEWGYPWTEEPPLGGYIPQSCNPAFTESLEFALNDNPAMNGNLDTVAAGIPPHRQFPTPSDQHDATQHQYPHPSGVDHSAFVVTEMMWSRFMETMQAIECALMEGLRSASAGGSEATTAQPFEDRSFVQYPPTYDVAGIELSTANRRLISEEIQLASEGVFGEMPGRFTTCNMSDRCPWDVSEGITSDGVRGVGLAKPVEATAECRDAHVGGNAMLNSAVATASTENSFWNPPRYRPEYANSTMAYSISDSTTSWNSDPLPASDTYASFGAEVEGSNTGCRLAYSSGNSHLYAQYETNQLRLSTETTLSNAFSQSTNQPLTRFPNRGGGLGSRPGLRTGIGLGIGPGFGTGSVRRYGPGPGSGSTPESGPTSEIKIRRNNLETRIVYPAFGIDQAWQSCVSRNIVGQYRVSENARIFYTQSGPPTADEPIHDLRSTQSSDVFAFSGLEEVSVDDSWYRADMSQLAPASQTGQDSELAMRESPGRPAGRRRIRYAGDTSESNQKMRRKRRRCSAGQSSARTRGKGFDRACGQSGGQAKADHDESSKKRLTSKGFQEKKDHQVSTWTCLGDGVRGFNFPNESVAVNSSLKMP